jgi:hypothetical protein
MLTTRSIGIRRLAALVFCVTGVLTSKAARAHFTLDTPACWLSQDQLGFPQKGAPCGPGPTDPASGTFTNMVTSTPAGQMLSVKVTATIAHTGWYRIALVKGSSLSQTPTSLPDPPGTTCKPEVMTDPVWSPTQPVIADNLPTGSHTFQVKLPDNITCTMSDPCTLQAIMVMTDGAFPDCYYHHCANIAIDDAPTSSTTGAIAVEPTANGKGCSCSIPGLRARSAWGIAGLAGLGVALVWRRRKRAAGATNLASIN